MTDRYATVRLEVSKLLYTHLRALRRRFRGLSLPLHVRHENLP